MGDRGIETSHLGLCWVTLEASSWVWFSSLGVRGGMSMHFAKALQGKR